MTVASMARWPATRPRVVVTGLGVVSCLGVGVKHFWKNLIAGRTGIVAINRPEFDFLPCRVGGLVPMGDEEGQLNEARLDSALIRQKGLSAMYGLIAADEALQDAKWHPEDSISKSYSGVSLGRVTSDMDAIGQAYVIMVNDPKVRRMNPYTAARAMCNMSAFTIGEKYGFTGPQVAPASACAAGAHAIIAAFQAIVLGDAKVMVCGGTDAIITPFCYSAFSKARALSTKFNDSPESASRPFDKDRDGFVAGDGAAVMVLEDLDHALSRNAVIYGEMLGYGMCQDTGSATSPDENGFGVTHCMTKAFLNSGVGLKDITYVNAHATSTPTGDLAEAKGILNTFSERSNSVFVASNKGAVGHMQGAAGAVEALSCVLSCQHALIPPTVNLREPDIPGLKYVMGKCEEWKTDKRVVVSNSFGFGSTCASLVFSNYL